MPRLDWIGKKAVENHHRDVPIALITDRLAGKGLLLMIGNKEFGRIDRAIEQLPRGGRL